MPPQRVTSAWRQSTALASSRFRKSASTYAYSPAATSKPAGPFSLTSRRPSKSAEDTGSSNQDTSHSRRSRCAHSSACCRSSAPFEST